MNKIESSAQKWLQKGRRVWIKANKQYPNPFQDAFLQGQIIQIQKTKHARVLLTDSKQQFRIPFQDCLKLTYGLKEVADMVDLQQLNQPQLLYNIKRRYIEDSVFTYCGPTLLIINPYCKIERLFNDNILQEYQSYVFTDTLEYKNLPPHIFGLAAFCLWQLFDNERNQSIVISGQSGAGKTQNTKYCLKFLASLGKNMKQLINQSQSLRKSKMSTNLRAAQKAVKKTSPKVYGIEDKILGCNQILQAFGNSKTIRNDNSSRFGKLILLVYGQTQIQIRSAFIFSYLLQKSRIVSVSEGERNYHIFYYFIKGTSREQKQKYLIKNRTQDYYYLNQSSVTTVPGIPDENRFQQMKREFSLYLTQEEIEAVLKILSVVLNLGNIKFKITQTKNNEQSAIIQNPEYIKIISQLLGVECADLQHSFQFKTRKMGLSVINSPYKFQQAISLRDSFAKNIYEKTFNFLIKKLNEKIQIQQISLDDEKNPNAYRKSIGLLDIFGFQVLNLNSLEQFFINFANQKLQQLYVSYIFKQEQNQFMREGLRQFSHDIGFQDNKPIIDLFENYPLGIFHLVNQSSELNQDDKDLPGSIQKNHSKNSFLKIPKAKRSCFQIVHSCSPVQYNTSGFTAKNKDQFPQQLLNIIQKSKSAQIHKICVGQKGIEQSMKQSSQKGGIAGRKFLGSKFLAQMNKLVEQLYSCDCHFVRCIKPNSTKSAKLFNSHAVLQSLRYLGVLDSIIIRKLGYIYRRPYKEFYKKFYELDNYIFSFHEDVKKHKTEDDFKRETQKIISKYAAEQLQGNNILLGHKKILIKESILNHLESITKEKRKWRINAANRFKIMFRNAVFRTKTTIFLRSLNVLKRHLKLLAGDIKEKITNDKVTKIQNVVKKFLWQKRFQKIKESATKSITKMSAYFRMKRQRTIYLDIKKKTVAIQANIRLYLAMGKIFRQKNCEKMVKEIYQRAWDIIRTKKTVHIQKIWRGFQVRTKFKKDIQTRKKNLKLAKIRVKFKRGLFQHKYNKFSQALNNYKKPIIKLQAIVRGRYLHRAYNLVKTSTMTIQKAFRRHLKKKFYLQRQWDEYKQVIKDNQEARYKQMQRIGLRMGQFRKARQLDQTNSVLRSVTGSEMLQNYVLKQKRQKLRQQVHGHNWQLNQTIQFPDKNTFQLYLIDYDSLSNASDQNKLVEQYEQVKQMLKNKMEYLVFADLTEDHLVLASNKDKLYKADLKGQSDLEQIPPIGLVSRIDSSGRGSIVTLFQEGRIYEWGLVRKSSQTNNLLSRDEMLSKQVKGKMLSEQVKCSMLPQQVKGKAVTNYTSKGQYEYIVCDSNKIFQRRTLFDDNKVQIIQLPPKTYVTQIAASYFFVQFLTNAGNIYSKGRNSRGQLGLGFQSREVLTLTLNEQLRKLKQFIQSVSVGYGHTLAKSKLGYVYGWGDNSYRQICSQGAFSSKPIKIENDSKPIKCFQIAAGLRASYMLTQNLKVLACGASLGFETTKNGSSLTQLTLLQETNKKSRFLNTVKLRCIWTKTQSLLLANAIDLSRCKEGSKPDAILKYTKSLAKQWVQNTIYPPYHEYIENCLNLSDLRKLKFKQKTQSKIHKKNQKITSIQQLKMILQLRKTSSMFRQPAKFKIQQFMGQMDRKNASKWTIQEKQLYEYIAKEFKMPSSQK